MRKHIKTIILIMCCTGLPVSAWGVSFTVDGRESNSLEKKLSETDTLAARFNYQDCIDDVNLVITVTDTGSDSSGDLYLAVGDNCPGSPGNCHFIALVDTSTQQDISIREIRNIEGADQCAGESTNSLWVGRADSETDTDGVWSTAIDIGWDMDPPSPPTGIDAKPGNQKVTVTWNGEQDDTDGGNANALEDDVDEIIVVYTSGGASAAGGDADADADVDGDADADGGIAPDIDTTTSGNPAGSGDAGAPAPPAPNFTFRSDETTADEAAADEAVAECPPGGFSEGDKYVPDAWKEKTGNGPERGNAVVGGLENGVAYLFGTVAVDDYNNPSDISATECATPELTTGFGEELVGDGGKVGKFCFIATAAFGSYDHPTVRVLRDFRDNFLEPMPGGETLIHTYYRFGPGAAAVVEHSPLLKQTLKGALTVFAGVTIPLSLLGPFGTLFLGALVVGVAVIRRRRRK